MRNWNMWASIPPRTMCHGFQRTYEELKRNARRLVRLHGTEFSAYLWGIETIQRWICWIDCWSFQRTYEELKQHFYLSVDTYNPCFQRTYEELKPGKPVIIRRYSVPFSAYLWGIETRIAFHSALEADWVFSVPMRNWNSQILKGGGKTEGVFSVPMRNWNSMFRLGFLLCHLFSAYLWGIETKQEKGPRKMFFVRFQRTYEELKLHPHPSPLRSYHRFSAYLWGIETL